MQNFFLIFNLVAPVFILVAIGWILKKYSIIDDKFIKVSSQIVFNLALPALIFYEIANTDLSAKFDYKIITYSYIAIFISFGLSWVSSYFFTKTPYDKSAFIQGSFRSNYAIIGLALIINVFGKESLTQASIVLAFTIPLFNLLAVVALTFPFRKERNLKFWDTIIEILKNPLVLSVVLSIPFALLNIKPPTMVNKSLSYLSNLTLPLALIGVGGYLKFENLKSTGKEAISGSIIKLIVAPLITTYIAYLLGFRGIDMGVLFILIATPAAVASFIMAEAMGSNGKLAANLLLISTLASVLTITIGLFILKEFGIT